MRVLIVLMLVSWTLTKGSYDYIHTTAQGKRFDMVEPKNIAVKYSATEFDKVENP